MNHLSLMTLKDNFPPASVLTLKQKDVDKKVVKWLTGDQDVSNVHIQKLSPNQSLQNKRNPELPDDEYNDENEIAFEKIIQEELGLKISWVIDDCSVLFRAVGK